VPGGAWVVMRGSVGAEIWPGRGARFDGADVRADGRRVASRGAFGIGGGHKRRDEFNNKRTVLHHRDTDTANGTVPPVAARAGCADVDAANCTCETSESNGQI